MIENSECIRIASDYAKEKTSECLELKLKHPPHVFKLQSFLGSKEIICSKCGFDNVINLRRKNNTRDFITTCEQCNFVK